MFPAAALLRLLFFLLSSRLLLGLPLPSIESPATTALLNRPKATIEQPMTCRVIAGQRHTVAGHVPPAVLVEGQRAWV